jgi:hypothetical protein
MTEVNWEFDAKDSGWEKYGNFSSPTIMKLISKYNKLTTSLGREAKAAEVVDIISK